VSSSRPVSRITFTIARPSTARTTPAMSFATTPNRPCSTWPTDSTMSISDAPSSTAAAASNAFTRGSLAPSGNPTTAQIWTLEPASRSRQKSTQIPFTQTLWKP